MEGQSSRNGKKTTERLRERLFVPVIFACENASFKAPCIGSKIDLHDEWFKCFCCSTPWKVSEVEVKICTQFI